MHRNVILAAVATIVSFTGTASAEISRVAPSERLYVSHERARICADLVADGRWDEGAVACAQVRASSSADMALAKTYLSIALTNLGRHGEAREAIVAATRHSTRFAETHYQLGNVRAMDGDNAAAVAAYDTALAMGLNEPERALFNRGLLLSRMGRADAARQSLETARQVGDTGSEATERANRRLEQLAEVAGR